MQNLNNVHVVELVDTPLCGGGAARRARSSLVVDTSFQKTKFLIHYILTKKIKATFYSHSSIILLPAILELRYNFFLNQTSSFCRVPFISTS